QTKLTSPRTPAQRSVGFKSPVWLPGQGGHRLGVHRLVDRLVRHAARLVGGVLGRQSPCDRGASARARGTREGIHHGRLGAGVAAPGARTEELRALTWSHVDLTGNPVTDPPVPPHMRVWRSVRAGGDTRTRTSRRTLALRERCVEALNEQHQRQGAKRLAGSHWKDSGLVFASEA